MVFTRWDYEDFLARMGEFGEERKREAEARHRRMMGVYFLCILLGLGALIFGAGTFIYALLSKL